MTLNQTDELPKGWARTSLEEIAEINPALPFSPPNETEVTFLPMKAVQEITGEFDHGISRKYKEVKKGYTSFADGDIIFAKITPCMENGKIAIVNNLKNGIGFGSTEFHVLRVRSSGISKKLLFYFLTQQGFRKDAKMHMTGSAGQLRVPSRYLETAPFILPPSNEQLRIVGKVEELFSFLDAGIASLHAMQVQLKRYRQAILKAAFEGKLTEEWRKNNLAHLRPAREEIVPLDSKDLKGLSKLPKSWQWTKLSIIGTLDRGKSKHRPRDDKRLFGGKYPFIQTGDVRSSNGKINSYTQTYSEQGLKQSRLWPPNTLCITIAANIAETALLDMPACFPDSIVGFNANKDLCETQFIHYFIVSAKDKLASFAPATAQKNINLAILRNLLIPLAPLEEQRKIINEIELLFSVADKTEEIIRQNLKQSQKLRQSVLREAFEGKLVPQHPDDEPAEKLLQHIRDERLSNRSINNNEVELSQFVK